MKYWLAACLCSAVLTPVWTVWSRTAGMAGSGRPMQSFPLHWMPSAHRTPHNGPNSHFTGWFALAIFLPVAPDDFLCYLAGTTAMCWSIFALIIFACKPFAIALYSTGLNVAFRMLLPG